MQINIPPAEHQQLITLAALHGFDTPEEYASSIVVNAVRIEALAELSPEEMAASVRSIECGIEQSKAGLGVPANESIRNIAANLDLNLPK